MSCWRGQVRRVTMMFRQIQSAKMKIMLGSVLLTCLAIGVEAGRYFRYQTAAGISQCDDFQRTDDIRKLKQCARRCLSSTTCIWWTNRTRTICTRSDDEPEQKENFYVPIGLPVIYIINNKGKGEFIKRSLLSEKNQKTGIFIRKYITSFVYVKARRSLIWSTPKVIYEQVPGEERSLRLDDKGTHNMQVHGEQLYYIPGRFYAMKTKIITMALAGPTKLWKSTWHVSKAAKIGLAIAGDMIYWIQHDEVEALYWAELPSNKTKRFFCFKSREAIRLSVEDVTEDISVFAWLEKESYVPNIRIYINIGGKMKKVCHRNDSSSIGDCRAFILDYPYLYYSTCGTNKVEARRLFMDCSLSSPVQVALFLHHVPHL